MVRTAFSDGNLTDLAAGRTVDVRKDWGEARQGNISGKQIEFWNAVPDFSLRSKLGKSEFMSQRAEHENAHHAYDDHLRFDLVVGPGLQLPRWVGKSM